MQLTYQIKAIDMLVTIDSLKVWNSGLWIRKIRKDRTPNQEIQKKGKSGKINFVQRARASQKAAEGRILASNFQKAQLRT